VSIRLKVRLKVVQNLLELDDASSTWDRHEGCSTREHMKDATQTRLPSSLATQLAALIGGPLVKFAPARPGKLVRGGK
jgi:hypothetical protein